MKRTEYPLICLMLAAIAVSTILIPASLFADELGAGENDKVIIGGDHNYPPYEFLDKNGKPTGYNVELTQALAETMGLNVEVHLGRWGETRKALESGKIDAIHGMFYSEERDKVVDFSSPHTMVYHAIFARQDSPAIKSEEDLRGKEIIVMRGDIMHDYVLENGLSNNPVLVETQADALRHLASGKHDCALVAKLPGLYWVRELKLSNIVTVGPPIRPSKYCYAVKDGNAMLLAPLNEGLAILSETGRYKEIYDKWLGVLEPPGISTGVIIKYGALILIPLAILLVASAVWTSTLKKQVVQRTRELEREIIERKHAEEALQKSEAQLSNAMKIAQLGHWEYDVANDLFTFNDHFLFIFRTSAEQVGGYTMPSARYAELFVHPEDRQVVGVETQKAIETTDPHYYRQLEHRIIYADGEIGYIAVRFSIIKDNQGRTVKTYGANQDITDRKRAEEEKEKLQAQLQRADKMEVIGTLAGGVAHDLNNVLSGLVSYPDLMLMDLPEDSPLREPILTIQTSGKKAAAIVHDLLTLARRGVAVSEVTNLNDVINEYLKSPEYKKLKEFYPNVQVEADLETDLLNVLASPVHLSKTVMNLVSNAAEALSGSGTMNISTKNQYIDKPIKGYDEVKEGDYIVLTVADDGMGIAASDLERIFEPFYTKKVMGRSGTGLGMAVVWGTVKDHDGYIHVESTEGKGTTITLYFPVTREEAKKEESVSLEAYMGKGERVLVADDVKEQRQIATMLLTKLGYSVNAVSSGEEAIEYVKTNSPDLLILDMIMDPGIDGLDTYKEILQLHPGQKAVIASGFSETDRVKEAQKLGAGQYVKKPYTLKNIGMAVKAELKR